MLKLEAAAVQKVIYAAMPSAASSGFQIRELADGYAEIVFPYQEWMLRPGGTLSGPAIMTAADVAMYVLVLGHYGAELLAVTSDLNIRFLAKPQAKNLRVTARFLKRGARLLVMECCVHHEHDDVLLAQVSGSYMRPVA